jgi:Family of unknown function (DUF6498)
VIAMTNVAGIAQIVARNIVPLVGILFFHWSAPNVLILYFVDTLLSMAVIFAGAAKTFAPPTKEGIAARINAEGGYILAALFAAGIIAIPIGMPVGIALATSEFSFRMALHDESLRNGLLIQCVLSLWSYIDLRRTLATYTREQIRLKRRFAFVFLRWIAVLMACYFVLDLVGGDLAVYLLIAVYIGASIFAEVAPERFLEVMPGGGGDLTKEEPVKPAATPGRGTPSSAGRKR